jgi:hypothetical protein
MNRNLPAEAGYVKSNIAKVFWSFFSKKDCFILSEPPPLAHVTMLMLTMIA